MENNEYPIAGGCTCSAVRYQLHCAPMFVHCCHCTWCQRETGSAFAVNAMIETGQLELLSGAVEHIETPSNSGAGQTIVRCPQCEVALWSHYGAAKERIAFVRVGTLDESSACPPDIHIFTSTKLPWVALTDGKPAMEEFYRRSLYWPEASVTRYQQALKDG